MGAGETLILIKIREELARIAEALEIANKPIIQNVHVDPEIPGVLSGIWYKICDMLTTKTGWERNELKAGIKAIFEQEVAKHEHTSNQVDPGSCDGDDLPF